MPASRFVEALNDQVANEFAASHQYVAIGAHYESQTLPQLARFFYAQARRGARARDDDDQVPARHRLAGAPARGRCAHGGFADHIAPIRLALEQERRSSTRSATCSHVAREEGDYLSEQFVQWFLKEQVEEEATMTELLDVAERVRDFPMTLEEFIAREKPGGGPGRGPLAPEPPAAPRRARLAD